ncbi:hypothetical protein [Anaeromicrobium sediminis]|uniref:Uncharacterized protein n=1 Tax=Anaeromicrobium sediminis TaxID=1478221 RepID=A0A267MQR9_9FIRM|nr:hypothetical protein [Anaeromicrobium sediminis]PAB61080.1 hypothetical protein CCE28_01235 [Anaeromicrobium sediminis]
MNSKIHNQKQQDNHENEKDTNSLAFKYDLSNRSNQLNPTNPEFKGRNTFDGSKIYLDNKKHKDI